MLAVAIDLRDGASCSKLFQTPQYVISKKMLKDFNTEEESSLYHILADLLRAHMTAQLRGATVDIT